MSNTTTTVNVNKAQVNNYNKSATSLVQSEVITKTQKRLDWFFEELELLIDSSSNKELV